MEAKTQQVKVEFVLNVPIEWTTEDVQRYLMGCMAQLTTDTGDTMGRAN